MSVKDLELLMGDGRMLLIQPDGVIATVRGADLDELGTRKRRGHHDAHRLATLKHFFD